MFGLLVGEESNALQGCVIKAFNIGGSCFVLSYVWCNNFCSVLALRPPDIFVNIFVMRTTNANWKIIL